MNLRQKNLLTSANFFKLLFIILPFTSFFFSLYQLNHQYDGHHHGLVFSISEDFLNGKIPYKDFLPHYGVFFIFLNSIFIKVFSNSIYGIYFLISLSKGITFLIFGMIIKKKFDEKIAISAMIIMFLLHPFVDTPWPDYLFFSFLLLSFYIVIISRNNFLFLLSGIFYSIAGLTKDNFMITLFFCIISFFIFLYFLKIIKKKVINNNLINIYWFFGYLIPLIAFFAYLKYNLILYEYLNHFKIGSLATKYYCTSTTNFFFLRTLDCGFIALKHLFQNSITKIFTEPYWFFFLFIIVTNIFFIINIIFFDKKKIINNEKKLMIWISFLSLILFSNNLYFLTVQRLFTGVSIGTIVLIYLIQRLKSPINRYFLYSIFCVFLINGFQLARTPNNPIYPTYSEKYNNHLNNIEFLKFKKLSSIEWRQLNEFKSLTNAVSNKCSFINYSTNLTNDVFYRIILKENFELLNFIPFVPRNKFISEMYKTFDENYYQKLNKEISDQNIVIAIDNVSKINIDLKNNPDLYSIKPIKYNNYGTKFINIYLPKSCKI